MSDAPSGSGPDGQPEMNNSGPSGSGGSKPPVSTWNAPPPPPPGYGQVYAAPAAPSRTGGIVTRVVTGLVASLLLISIILNFYLGIFFVSSMRGPQETVYAKGDDASRIVILPVSGTIDESTAVSVRQSLVALRENPPKAIVLRVDSPGGGVSASDRIWHELQKYKAEFKIPIVASFGSLAASGGYYISADADFIFVEPTTITGSIGVIAQAFTVQNLLDKIGVTPEVIAATDATKKDTLSPFRAWTEKDRNELRVILDQAYVRFVDIVANGRSKVLTREQVMVLATGEVFTAQQALANKLADEEGYLDAAIEKAKTLAGLEADSKPAVMVISPQKHFSIMSLLGQSHVNPVSELLDSNKLRNVAGELATPSVEYRATLR